MSMANTCRNSETERLLALYLVSASTTPPPRRYSVPLAVLP